MNVYIVQGPVGNSDIVGVYVDIDKAFKEMEKVISKGDVTPLVKVFRYEVDGNVFKRHMEVGIYLIAVNNDDIEANYLNNVEVAYLGGNVVTEIPKLCGRKFLILSPNSAQARDSVSSYLSREKEEGDDDR